MAYSRFSKGGGAYILRMIDRDGVICMACRFMKGDLMLGYDDFTAKDAKAMLIHIRRHQRKGDKISEWGIERLREEAGFRRLKTIHRLHMVGKYGFSLCGKLGDGAVWRRTWWLVNCKNCLSQRYSNRSRIQSRNQKWRNRTKKLAGNKND